MIPSSSYFPTSLGGRADWYLNFSTQFTLVGPGLGFDAAVVTSVQADNQLMQFLRSANVQMDAVMDASRKFRKVITEGVVGSPTPNWPTQFLAVPADPTPDTGLFQRLDELVKQIRATPAYTPEVGALLGIIPSQSDPIAPDELKPELSVTAMPGNIIQVYFKRGSTNGVDLQIQIDNDVVWNDQGRYVQSPAQIVVPENPLGLPRAVQVRGRYFQGNTSVGLYSDVDVVATTP